MTTGHADGTASDADAAGADLTGLAAFVDATGAMRRLLPVAAVQGAGLALLLGTALLIQSRPGSSPALDALLHEGAAGLVGAALTISLTASLVCLLLAWGRRRTLRRHTPGRLPMVTRLAGWPQALLILAGMASAVLILSRFPSLPPDPAMAAPGWAGIAGLILVPTFLLLVCERMIAATPDRLPEAPRLAILLRVPVATLLWLAVLASATGFGLAAARWHTAAWAVLLLLLAGELAVRTLGIWFLPLPAPEAARAAIGSLLAALLQPGTLRPAKIAQQMRARLGIDVGRSWAMGYVRVAAPPVLLGLILLAWGLSGVTRIELAERGSYERFGAPVAMLRPGLHLLLPWPFGQVRRVEYGVVHAVSVGTDSPGAADPADTSTADGNAPTTANRLWDQRASSDISYLIASHSAGKQSFETVSVDIRVLYRIGLDDQSARRALYGVVAPDALVGSLAGRLLAGFFADRTLVDVLGARREQVANDLRASLQTQLDARQSGIEVVALVVESMHPPGGAAVAYRNVQAAEIIASTQKAQETGRAHSTLSVAARDGHDVADQAQAAAAERVAAAQSERWQSDADTVAYRDSGRAFLLERYFSNLRTALGTAALEIVDHRLGQSTMPMIDLRAAAGIPAQAGVPAPDVPPAAPYAPPTSPFGGK